MDVNKIIALIGPAGSGKGTLAKRLIAEGYIVVTVSDILRANKVEIPTNGALVPDEVVVPLIKKEVDNSDGILVLDGFPRTPAQAKALFDFNIKIDRVVVLDLPLEVLLERTSDRVLCKFCRETYTKSDFKRPKDGVTCDECGKKIEYIEREEDKPENVMRRYDDYKNTEKEIADVFKQHHTKIVTINTSKPYSLMEVLS